MNSSSYRFSYIKSFLLTLFLMLSFFSLSTISFASESSTAVTTAVVGFEEPDLVLGGLVPGPDGSAPVIDGIFGTPGGVIPSMGYTAEYAMLLFLLVLFITGAIGYSKVKKQQNLSKRA